MQLRDRDRALAPSGTSLLLPGELLGQLHPHLEGEEEDLLFLPSKGLLHNSVGFSGRRRGEKM